LLVLTGLVSECSHRFSGEALPLSADQGAMSASPRPTITAAVVTLHRMHLVEGAVACIGLYRRYWRLIPDRAALCDGRFTASSARSRRASEQASRRRDRLRPQCLLV